MIQVTALPSLFRAAPWRLKLLHGAPRLRLIWMTAGQARCVLGPRMRGTGVHSLMVIPPRVPFALEPGAALAGLMLSLPEDPPGTPPAIWPDTPLLLRVRDTFRQSEIGGLLDAVQREDRERRPLYADAMQAYIPLLAIWLHRQLELEENVPERETPADLITNAFLADLEARFGSGDTVADYARRIGITPTHLTRVCKAQLRMSAADLMATRVLHAARDRLETTSLAAKQIAAELGFGSGAAFSRFVQARAGQSPMALRKAARLSQASQRTGQRTG